VDCSGCPEVDLGVLGTELLEQLQGRRYPLSGSIELTERCNLRCLHCYINQPAGSQEAMANELTLPQIQDILDQIVDAGCLFLLSPAASRCLGPISPISGATPRTRAYS